MISIGEFRAIALSFPGTVETPHFDKAAFKIIDKRIFATLHESSLIANLKLDPEEQKAFCLYKDASIYPVPNKWGAQGWTTFDLNTLPRYVLAEALETAYRIAKKDMNKRKL